MKVLSFFKDREDKFLSDLAAFVSAPDAQTADSVSRQVTRFFMETLLGGCAVDDSTEGLPSFEQFVSHVYDELDNAAEVLDSFRRCVYMDMDLTEARKVLWPLVETVRYGAYADYWLSHIMLRMDGYYSSILDATWPLAKSKAWQNDEGKALEGTFLPPTRELIKAAMEDARPKTPAVKAEAPKGDAIPAEEVSDAIPEEEDAGDGGLDGTDMTGDEPESAGKEGA